MPLKKLASHGNVRKKDFPIADHHKKHRNKFMK